MSFYRAPFRDFVREQLEHRVDFLARGRGNEKRPDKWYQQYLTKQAFVRVSPLVRIVKDDEKGINGLPNTPGFDGSTNFMKNFVLEGVPLKNEGNNSSKPFTSFKKMPQFPSNPSPNGNYNSLLNNPILKTSPDSDGFGIVPPPGVISCGVDTKSFYGNLREAKLSIRCFSIAQFEWVEKLYARPGHHILLEWGWDHYIDNSTGEINNNNKLISDREDFWDDNIDAGKIYRLIEFNKKGRYGNYDGFLGIIKNFTSKVETDGGFTIDVQLIGRGDLLESIPLWEKSQTISGTPRSTIQFYRDDDAFISSEGTLTRYVSDDTSEDESDAAVEWGKEDHNNLVNLSHFLMKQPYMDVFNELTDPTKRWVIQEGAFRDLRELSKKSTVKTTTGLPGANYGFFTPKSNVDTFILNDPYTSTVLSSDDDRTLGAQEVGLGPFVRLGYLLKCVNYLGIEEDGVGKPTVTINNLLYHKDFDPREDPTASDFSSKGACNIYPSCYSNFLFEGTHSDPKEKLYNDFTTQLLNNYIDSFIEDAKTIKSNKEILKSKGISEKNIVGTVLKNHGTTTVEWRQKIAEYYRDAFELQEKDKGVFYDDYSTKIFKQQSLAAKLAKFKITKLADPNEDPTNYIYDVINFSLKNIGSCQPGKVLFPHQFVDPNRFKDWKEYPKENGINPNEKLYNLPILTEYSSINKTYNSWGSLFKTSYGKRNAQAIISDDAMSSLSSHAMIDALAVLASHNKITQAYYDQLYSVYTKNKLKDLHNTMYSHTEGQYNPLRVIDNIMISTHWLSKYLEDNEGKLTLGQFLKEICKIINESSGGSTDLKVVDNPVFPDQISIVDFNVTSTVGSNTQFSFPKGGHTSIFKKLSLTGKIPDAQASTIAIGAQGPRDTTNIESVTYAAFLEDIEDRISHPKGSSSPNQDKLIELKKKTQKKYSKTFIRFFQNAIDMHLLYVCMNLDSGGSRKEWYTKLSERAKRSASRLKGDILYLASHNPDGSAKGGGRLPISSIIPLKISIGMEGVSGILASNTFKLDKGILPQKYNQERVSYMVSKEKQTIKGGVWETTIEGTLVLDDNGVTPKSTQPEISSPPKTKAKTFEGSSNPVGRPNIYQSSFDAASLEDTTLGDFTIPIDPNSKGKYVVSSVRAKRTGISGVQSSQHGGWDLVSS